jgi:thiamine-monophosphate kinase
MAIKSIPIPIEVRRYAEKHNLDPYELALYGGEEYALVFTLRRDYIDKLPKSLAKKIHVMGVVTSDKKLRLEVDGGERKIEARGWEHFRSST